MSIKHVQLIYSNCEVESNKFENSFKNLPLIYNHLPDDLMFVSSDSELSEWEVNFSWSEYYLSFINEEYLNVFIGGVVYYPVITIY
jgi:hypothetical protein